MRVHACTHDLPPTSCFLHYVEASDISLKYTQLINFKSDEYSCKVARTVEEATVLVEAGFEHVCDFEEAKLFRKRK